jgi:hypothetical protein
MARAEPYLGRFLSKFLLAVIPGVVASGLAVFVLYAIHLSHVPEPAERLTDAATEASAANDGLTGEERRELTRQMLKARRDNPEVPALVKPTPRPVTTATAAPGDVPSSAFDEKARAATGTVTPLPRPARPQPVVQAPVVAPAPAVQTPAVVTAAVPPPAAAAPPVATAAATRLPPVEVNTAVEAQPERRGFAANVFSSISVFAGTAANATGNSVNWVIELPGKAISAGGRLLGGNSAAPPPPGNPPPVEAAPKRDYL